MRWVITAVVIVLCAAALSSHTVAASSSSSTALTFTPPPSSASSTAHSSQSTSAHSSVSPSSVATPLSAHSSSAVPPSSQPPPHASSSSSQPPTHASSSSSLPSPPHSAASSPSPLLSAVSSSPSPPHSASSSSHTAAPSSAAGTVPPPPPSLSSSSLHPSSTSATFHATSTTPSSSGGYTGYQVTQTGSNQTAVYSTTSSPNPAVYNPSPADVVLHAAVNVNQILITVNDLTAHVNLNAKVANLFTFTAGVDVAIKEVQLNITNVVAEVFLEVRLENLVQIVNRTLTSLDLNPNLNNVTRLAQSAVTNLLVSFDTNGHHINRVVDQSGNIVDQVVSSTYGVVLSQSIVGNYLLNMTYNGVNQTLSTNPVRNARQYVYHPFPGLSAVVQVVFNAIGAVIGTSVLSDAQAGDGDTLG